ncbi:hypothetical protein K443DRAFT_675226 [Laccaria amethystina LaAM-08-1]|uniref:Uncharacterized protein n=1 Tax=Laccaria amethystina LaAM-08-1 TaxID=1095629 RepID=A0A0C9XJP2_9AGAR|nr:hypothetical protein K443DRAFT_675226 [Laccaria amethystina LaAM-08-1]
MTFKVSAACAFASGPVATRRYNIHGIPFLHSRYCVPKWLFLIPEDPAVPTPASLEMPRRSTILRTKYSAINDEIVIYPKHRKHADRKSLRNSSFPLQFPTSVQIKRDWWCSTTVPTYL